MEGEGFLIGALIVLWSFGGVIIAVMLIGAWLLRNERQSNTGVGGGDSNQYGPFGGDGGTGDGGGDGGCCGGGGD